MLGPPTCWEALCKATEHDDDTDPTVLAYRAIHKENGIQPTTMKEVRSSAGHERESWRLAMQVDVGRLRGNQTFEVASAAELWGLKQKNSLPMNMW